MLINSLSARLSSLIAREEGQDLVEYALVVALIAFAAVAGINSLARGLNNVFSTISGTLSSAL